MNNSLPYIIARLRAERKLTQKLAAADLGVSQSLLSHYENGIRECSLDFLCRAADYYGVTTDYLLGRTERRASDTADARIPDDDLPETEKILTYNSVKVKVPSQKDIFRSLSMILDLLKNTGDKDLEAEIALYFALVVYRIYRSIYKSVPDYAGDIFSLATGTAMRGTAVECINLESSINDHINGKHKNGTGNAESMKRVRTDVNYLMEHYPKAARSLIRMLDAAESVVS